MTEMGKAVKNAIDLYAKTGGMSVQEALARFAENEEARQNIYMLVALQATTLPYGAAAVAGVDGDQIWALS